MHAICRQELMSIKLSSQATITSDGDHFRNSADQGLFDDVVRFWRYVHVTRVSMPSYTDDGIYPVYPGMYSHCHTHISSRRAIVGWPTKELYCLWLQGYNFYPCNHGIHQRVQWNRIYCCTIPGIFSPPFHRGFLRFDHPWTLGGTIAHGIFNKNPANIEYPYFLKSPSFEPSDSYYKVLDICRKPKGILVESGPLGVYGAGNICKRSSWGRQAVELDQTWTRRRENKTHREHCDV